LLLLILAAGGVAGVLYWRQSLHAPAKPVVAAASEPAKHGKQRRRKRGARRMARNEVFVASGPPSEEPTGAAPSYDPPPRDRPPPEERPLPEHHTADERRQRDG